MSSEASCDLPSPADANRGHAMTDTLGDDDSITSTSSTTGNSTTNDIAIHSDDPLQFGVTSFFQPSQATLRVRPAAAAAAAATTTTTTAATTTTIATSLQPLSITSPSPFVTASASASTVTGDAFPTTTTTSDSLDKGISTANRLHAAREHQLNRGFSHGSDQFGGTRDLDAQHSRRYTHETPEESPPAPLQPAEGSSALQTAASSGSSATTSKTSENQEDQDKSASSDASKEGTPSTADSGTEYSCNICFDTAVSPVLTLCGHLFCWSCLHQWLEAQRLNPLCPVCKAGCGQDKVIPIYGRGREQVDPRTTTPKRPAGQRPEPVRQANGGFTFGNGQVTFSGTMISPFMFSPLGIHFGGASTIHINAGAQSPTNAYISRMLMMLGVMMLVAILLY
ncbi:hypothetical protein BGW41_000389 [Actinomortierella wolfii]|nr:hypothetical protein BGW41_000389 [Actinomortierella wolfii]